MDVIDPDGSLLEPELAARPYDRFADPAYVDLLRRVAAGSEAIDVIIAEDGEM